MRLSPDCLKQEAVSLQLVGVRGPGNVSLYATDALEPHRCSSTPEMALMSRMCSQWLWDWAFTAPGVYKVDVQASTLVGAGRSPQPGVYKVDVQASGTLVPGDGLPQDEREALGIRR